MGSLLQFFRDQRDRFSRYRRQKFLESHGCTTEKSYERKFDADTNQRATRIIDWYHGYPHIYVVANYNSRVYLMPGNRVGGLNTVLEWCDENLNNKFRWDMHRVIKQLGWSGGAVQHDDWAINGIGGDDLIFFAFKDEADYLLFTLRWGGQ